jgi:hypothetical protein
MSSMNLQVKDSKKKCLNLYNNNTNISRTYYTLNDIYNFFSPKIEIEPYVIFPLSKYRIIDDLVSNHINNNNKKKDDDVALKLYNKKADNILIYSPSDKDYGGSSMNHINYIDGDDNNADGSFFRWHGNLEFTSEQREKTQAKSGYCAMKIDYNKALDLLDYNGLLLKIRSIKKQKVILSIKCLTYIKDDMFQLCLEIPSSSGSTSTRSSSSSSRSSNEDGWISIFVPFDMFVLTSKGYAKEQPMKNDSLNVESIIFLLKDDLMNDDTSEDLEEEEDTEGKKNCIAQRHISAAFYYLFVYMSTMYS